MFGLGLTALAQKLRTEEPISLSSGLSQQMKSKARWTSSQARLLQSPSLYRASQALLFAFVFVFYKLKARPAISKKMTRFTAVIWNQTRNISEVGCTLNIQ